MPDRTVLQLQFPGIGRRVVQAEFTGGDVTSDGGGAILLRQTEKRLSLLSRVAQILPDERRQKSCDHSQESLLCQRVFAVAMGYEDLNDHQTLRKDPGFQTAVGSLDDLASNSTLCRWENRAGREAAWAMHEVMVDVFMESFDEPPDELVLDFDSTDDAVHGRQERRFFHGYYDKYCFLPLYVFCGDQLLVAYLRPSKIGDHKHAWAILSFLVRAFRSRWPEVRIIFRGDSGFCRHRMLDWCDSHDVGYIVGYRRNPVVERMAEPTMLAAVRARGRSDLK